MIDLYSRRLLGYASGLHPDAELAAAAINMAVAARGGDVAGVIFHTDRGSTYTADRFTELCRRLEIVQSMRRVGSCFDCEHDGVAVRSDLTPATNDFVSLR